VQLVQYRPAIVIASSEVERPSFEIQRAQESDLDGICEAPGAEKKPWYKVW
jgi:hypothetical protein